MNDAVIAPESVDQLKAVVASEKSVLAVGNRTKPPLSACADTTLVSLSALSGIIQYEPSEFTFTAFAGSRVSEIEIELSQKQQYLPFDPMLVRAGATMGGTVASGLAGPGRFRYGGIRDFLLGVKFVSGDGKLITAGGKVVKNAAGFDIPKFLVGSLGRFGMMTELTFKVFPQPQATRTLAVGCPSHQVAMERMASAASSRWELDAIDYRPDQKTIYLRLAGPEPVIDSLVNEIRSRWAETSAEWGQSDRFWPSVRELSWSEGSQAAVKVPTTPQQYLRLQALLEMDAVGKLHLSVAGNVLWILLDSNDQITEVDAHLQSLAMPGIVVQGVCDDARIGKWPSSEMETAIKAAMDTCEKFPGC